MIEKHISPSLQDFSLVRTNVQQFTLDLDLKEDSMGFIFFVLDLVSGLQDEEADEAITDTYYLKLIGKQSGHDRGIDALFIDNSESPATIHLFNMKYTGDHKKTINNFPSGEIDKILSFISSVISSDESICDNINRHLYSKVEEIWELFKFQNPKFKIHLCANFYNGLEESEKNGSSEKY
jgi:hypothetical protein